MKADDLKVCQHGLAGFCPDCPPSTLTVGELRGAPSAVAVRRTVWRYKPDGSLDWVTYHFTKWGAQRAADRYMRDGKVKGFRP